MTFGTGDHEVKVLLEFFASGNVILVDPKYSVLSLLRSHRDDAKGVATMSQHAYPIQTIKLRTATVADDFREALAASLGDPAGKTTLKEAVARCSAYGPQVAGYCIRRAGLDPKRRQPLSGGEPDDEAAFQELLEQVWAFEKWVDSCEDTAPAGCITVDASGKYHDFQPLVHGEPIVEPAAGMTRVDFPTFDEAAREFFSKIQGDRTATQVKQQENAAQKKLEAIRNDHAMRIQNLHKEVDLAERKAAVLSYNLNEADAAMDSVREALAAGFSWEDLEEMIEEERADGNPVALLIDGLQLERNAITLCLDDLDAVDAVDAVDAADGGQPRGKRTMTVEVDLGLSSAHANVEAYFEMKKRLADKARRTIESNDKALAAAEKNVLVKLKKIQEAKLEQAAGGKSRTERKPYWFEKFHWFISSENYLVVSGRDAQQNEQLVRRHLRKGDAYVHAELHGASSTIVKNNDPSAPIPFMTLSEAGQACVARSSAWDAKVTAAAYWVRPDQVSKTAPSGEYLTTGSMMIRGRKNYLPTSQLVMGIGWLFKLEEGSIAAHRGERRVREANGGVDFGGVDAAQEAIASAQSKSALEKILGGSSAEEYSITMTDAPKQRGKAKAKGGDRKGGGGGGGGAGGGDGGGARDPGAQTASKEVSMRTMKKKQKKQGKYRDQDEDERELAKAFLASGGEKKNRDRKARKEVRKAKMTARKMAASGIEQTEVTKEGIAELTQRLGDVVVSEEEDDARSDVNETAETESRGAEAAVSPSEGSGDKGADHANADQRNVNAQHNGAADADDADDASGYDDDDDDDFEPLEANASILDQLTGNPRPGDELLAALPVIAPYSTLASYKYSVKLLPGTQKKGKAYKQAVELIRAKFAKASAPRELTLLEAITLEEGINAMLGSVTLQSSGMQKIRQQQRDKKKANKAAAKKSGG